MLHPFAQPPTVLPEIPVSLPTILGFRLTLCARPPPAADADEADAKPAQQHEDREHDPGGGGARAVPLALVAHARDRVVGGLDLQVDLRALGIRPQRAVE